MCEAIYFPSSCQNYYDLLYRCYTLSCGYHSLNEYQGCYDAGADHITSIGTRKDALARHQASPLCSPGGAILTVSVLFVGELVVWLEIHFTW